MIDLVVDPDAFFAEEARDPDLLAGGVVVVVAAVLTVTSELVLLNPTMRAPFPQDVPLDPGFVRTSTLVGAGIGVVATVLFWVIATGVFHVVASQTEGEGAFTETLALTGFGYVATIVAALVSLVGTYLALQAAGDPTAAGNVFEFQQAISRHPARQFQFVPAVALLLWQGLLWTYAVKHAYGVTRREATIAVAGPVALVLLLKLVGPVLGLLLG